MNIIHSTLDSLRDRLAPISHTSTFRSTGQVTPEEFVLAGDYLVYKFPTWSWSDASSPAKRVAHLPPGKQFLVTRGVPCARRLGEGFAGEAGEVERVVKDELGKSVEGDTSDGKERGQGEEGTGVEDDGWLQTGPSASGVKVKSTSADVRTLGEGGEQEAEQEEEEEIPDLEDEEDEEAIIRETKAEDKNNPLRNYTLYITYTPYYRTPRLYLSGSLQSGQPLSPPLMMEDIVGDYADKTVTLEDFPFFDSGLKMASIHPCRHASVMKVLLDRADAAMKLRLERLRRVKEGEDGGQMRVEKGMEGLVDEMSKARLAEEKGRREGTKAAGAGDEWEMLQQEQEEEAIRVDQYLVVFLKFMASVTPGMNYDFTMGV